MALPPRFPFTKTQALGNDFVVVDTRAWPEETDWPAAAIRLCDRHFGVGSDGLILVSPSVVADIKMRFFNSDGTPDMCGNGLRCLIRYAEQNGLITEPSGSIETPAGLAAFLVNQDGTISTELPPPRFCPEEIPMLADGDTVTNHPLSIDGESLTISAVSTGSTHTVLFVEELPDDERFFRLSPRIEHHPAFPERTSVMWARLEGPDAVRLRIWERGVGETSGCGTGACAAAVCARVTNRVLGPHVHVHSSGGLLRVHWGGGADDRILLTGPAEIVYSGKI